MAKSRLPLPRGVTAGIAALLLALAIGTGIDVARDFHRQSDERQAEAQKRQLALLGELELGHAVQDFKDCLLRGDTSYCDDFDRHIQAVDRTVSLYGAQGAPQPDETRGAWSAPASALCLPVSPLRGAQHAEQTRHHSGDRQRSQRRRPSGCGGTERACGSLLEQTLWMACAARPGLLADGLHDPGSVIAVSDFPVFHAPVRTKPRNRYGSCRTE